MPKGLDPNDWIDTDEVFPDDYDENSITYAEFTIISGDAESLSLVYWDDGVRLEGGGTGCNWGLSFYSAYHCNSQTIPIGGRSAAHILSNLSSKGNNWKEYDWAAQDWVYVE